MIVCMTTEDQFEIPEAKMTQYRLSAARRYAEEERALQERLARAWQVARRAASLLKTAFEAQQVVAFGSLLQPELFHARSDVDLAAWGINEKFYYRAVAQLLSLDPEISFDLVRIEDASPSLQATILRDGVEV
jgi:predicted nucleotidyltransferase